MPGFAFTSAVRRDLLGSKMAHSTSSRARFSAEDVLLLKLLDVFALAENCSVPKMQKATSVAPLLKCATILECKYLYFANGFLTVSEFYDT